MRELIASMEKSLENKNWYAALVIALIIPDICGKIDNPKKSPTARYPIWYDNMLI